MEETITTLIMEDAEERLLFTIETESARLCEFDYLYAFVKHVINYGTSKSMLVSSVNRTANKQFISDLDANDACIRRTNRRVSRIQATICSPAPLSFPIEIENGDREIDVNNILCRLQNNIDALTAQKIMYKSLHTKYTIMADCNRLKERALMMKRFFERTLAFDMTDLDYHLPEDVVNYEILEFIGVDYIEKVRQRCVSKKHFAIARARLSELLWTWTMKDLRAYEKHVFMKYSISADRLDLFKFRKNKSTIKKGALIDYLLSGPYKCSFYNFQRDVFCLTRILAEKRREKRMARAMVIKNVCL